MESSISTLFSYSSSFSSLESDGVGSLDHRTSKLVLICMLSRFLQVEFVNLFLTSVKAVRIELCYISWEVPANPIILNYLFMIVL